MRADFAQADTMLELQRQERQSEAARARRSSVWGLSWVTAEEDAREAVTGILGDLHGTSASGRKSLREVFGHGDRLRGLGVACLAIALAGCAVQGLLSD
jgi:hypothetical protein